MTSVTREGLKKIALNLGLAQNSILDSFGNTNTPSVTLDLEGLMCNLRGSTLFYNDDYSRMYYPNALNASVIEQFDFVKFSSSDIVQLGLQGVKLQADNTQYASFPTISGASYWNPGYYGAPCPEGFGVWEYNAWVFYDIEKPSVNPSEPSYSLRLDYKFPVRYDPSSSNYSIVPFFEHARWISIKNTSTTVGYDDAIWSFDLTEAQLDGIKLRDVETDLPLDIRFMYYEKLIQGYSSNIWERINISHSSNSQLKYLAYDITDNNDGTYTFKINLPNDLVYAPYGSPVMPPTQADHVANKYWHIVMFWGTIDEEAFRNEVSYRSLKADNVTSIPVRVATDYVVWPVKNFFRKDLGTKITWDHRAINDLGINNLTDVDKQYLVAQNRHHFTFKDGEFSSPSIPNKYPVLNTIIDANSENSISNQTTNFLDDQYQSALLVVKTSGESTGASTEFSIVLGPKFFSDFARSDWENFEYYPVVPQENVEIAKIIFKKATGGSYANIEYNDGIDNEIFNPFDNNQATVYQTSNIIWIQQSVPSHAIKNFTDSLLASRLMPGYYNFLKAIRVEKGEDPVVSAASKLLPYSAQVPTNLAATRTSFLNPDGLGSVIFRKFLKSPTQDILQPEIDEPLAIQLDEYSRKTIETFASKPPSTEMLRLNSDHLFQTNNKLNLPNTFELFHEPSDNCNAADASTAGTRLGLDYTFRLNLEDDFENVLIKDWYIMASKFYITADEYQERQDKEQTVVGYFTQNNITDIDEWRLQGYAGIVPDMTMGESRVLTTRYVSPEDSTQVTEEQFRSNLEAQGFTQEEIDERVLRYLEQGNTFYVVDLNKYDNNFIALRSSGLAITTYTYDTTSYWKENLADFNKVTSVEPDVVQYSTLYSDSFTVALGIGSAGSLETYDRLASTYYDQTFDVDLSSVEMVVERNKYSFKFNSGSGGNFTDLGIKLKVELFETADTLLTDPDSKGFIKIYLYDNSTADLPGNLIATSKSSLSFTDIAEDVYEEYRWDISTNLKAGENYWVVLELTTAPQGGNIVIASQTPFSDKTYENIETEAFSFVNVIDTSDMKFTIPAKVLLNTDNTTGALTNSGELIFDIYSDNSDSIGDYEFTISSSIDFADFTEFFTNYSFTAASAGFSFVNNTKYWVISRTTVRPRGGVINLDLNNIVIDPIRHRIENSGTYNIWKDNSRKIWLALYEDFPQIYGVFNRFNTGLSKYLPPQNDKRSTTTAYKREGYWAFTGEKFTEPSDVYIYPRAVGIEDSAPPSNVDFSNPPAYWAYVPYYNDIYISIRLNCGGAIRDYIIHLDPTVSPEPILVNSDDKADSIAYMYVAKTLEELENGYHGAPSGDRLVLRSS